MPKDGQEDQSRWGTQEFGEFEKNATPRELMWFREYINNGGDATDAARKAGYRGNDINLRVQGHRLKERLRNPIRAYMQMQGLDIQFLMNKLLEGCNATKKTRMKVPMGAAADGPSGDDDPDDYDDFDEDLADLRPMGIDKKRDLGDSGEKAAVRIETFTDPDFAMQYKFVSLCLELVGVTGLSRALARNQNAATGLPNENPMQTSLSAFASEEEAFPPDREEGEDEIDQQNLTPEQARTKAEEGNRMLEKIMERRGVKLVPKDAIIVLPDQSAKTDEPSDSDGSARSYGANTVSALIDPPVSHVPDLAPYDLSEDADLPPIKNEN